MRRRLRLLFSAAALALALSLATAAQAEFAQVGKLLVSFDAGLSPTKLPRDRQVPVKVGFKGTFENLDASDTPALQTMTVKLASGGEIDKKGVPTCVEHRLAGLDSDEALAICGRAKVGEGTVSSAFRFPDGERARSKARLLLFNTSRGILMHLYATSPLEGTFLVPMSLHRSHGAFGTVLRAHFPRIAAGYGYLTGYQMVIDRRGYVKASCPAPPGFSKLLFEMAHATYLFRNGVKVENSAFRTCIPVG